MEKLLEAKLAGLHGASPKGEAVAAAIRERDLPKVRSLLDASPELLHAGDARSNQPIHWAVMTRQIEVIDELLSRGADINVQRSDGARPIQLTNGDYHYRGWRDVPKDVATTPQDVLAHLRARGAYVDICTAAAIGDLERVRELVDQDPSLANDPEALAAAAGNGHDGFVRLMLRYQPDLAKRVAVGAKTRELTELLFRHGMNASQPDWLRITPLHEFARKNDLEKAAIFIDHGADLHARDEDICSTPLAWAAKFGKTQMVEFLLQRGAKPNLPDDPPWATPLAWATRRGHSQIVELLKQRGAK